LTVPKFVYRGLLIFMDVFKGIYTTCMLGFLASIPSTMIYLLYSARRLG
jgi:hypothetical protein